MLSNILDRPEYFSVVPGRDHFSDKLCRDKSNGEIRLMVENGTDKATTPQELVRAFYGL